MIPTRYSSVQELQSASLGLSLRDIPAARATGPNTPTGLQNYEALNSLIMVASASADSYCRQVVGATQNTEQALTSDGSKAWVDRNGFLWFKADRWPIISISVFQYGAPSAGGPPAFTQANVSSLVVERTSVAYPGGFPSRGWPRQLVQVTYLNGYANAFLTAAVTAGDTTLPVDDVTGFLPNQEITVYDRGATETVLVDSAFTPPASATGGVPTPGNLPLAGPGVLFDHTPVDRAGLTGLAQPYDVRVSALPYDFSWAVLLVCKYFIQERGTSALVMGAAGGVRGRNEVRISIDEMPAEVKALLNPYAVVF